MNIDDVYKKMNFNTLSKILLLKEFKPLLSTITCMIMPLRSLINETAIGIDYILYYIGLSSVFITAEKLLPKNVISSDAKDIQEIKKLYDNVLENYEKLHHIFGFNHPVEIYNLFNYAYYNGFLSNDHVFNFNNYGVIDLPYMQGVNVINGKGVCRHVAAMLNDIYCDADMENIVLAVYTDLKSRISDHVINAVVTNDGCYYLDSTRFKWYNSISNGLLSDSDSVVKISLKPIQQICSSFSKESLPDVKTITSKPLLFLKEDIEVYSKSFNKIKLNIDILENFYNENKECYAEISDKILKLQKGKQNKNIRTLG